MYGFGARSQGKGRGGGGLVNFFPKRLSKNDEYFLDEI